MGGAEAEATRVCRGHFQGRVGMGRAGVVRSSKPTRPPSKASRVSSRRVASGEAASQSRPWPHPHP